MCVSVKKKEQKKEYIVPLRIPDKQAKKMCGSKSLEKTRSKVMEH